MTIRNTITKLVTLTMAVAALAVIGSIWAPGQAIATGRATEIDNSAGTTAEIALGDGSVRFFSSSISSVPGQTLRFSVFNPNPPEQGSGGVSGHVKIFDSYGHALAQSEEVELTPGQFRTFDFNRADLRAAGEPGTGRLQVRAEIICRFSDNPEQIPPDSFSVSMELVDNRTGQTTYYTGTVTVSSD